MIDDLTWKRSKIDGCQLYTCQEHNMEIVELYEPIPDGRYQLNIGGFFKGTGSLKSLKDSAIFHVNYS